MSVPKRSKFEKLLEKYYEDVAEMDVWDGVDPNEFQKAERRALKHLKSMHCYYPEKAALFEEGYNGPLISDQLRDV